MYMSTYLNIILKEIDILGSGLFVAETECKTSEGNNNISPAVQ